MKLIQKAISEDREDILNIYCDIPKAARILKGFIIHFYKVSNRLLD